MPDLRELAERHRLRHQKAPDGGTIVPGKRGFIYRHGPGRLGWALVYDNGSGTARWKEKAKRDPALSLQLEAECEALFTFAPEDLPYVARRWCQAKRRRQARPSDLANLQKARRLPTGRVSRSQNGRSGRLNGSGPSGAEDGA
ncbi:MAG: hypothetical protein O7H41_16110 [Planctomycetota bacterium]|nr:hypothetical protein [Planctomycetota bacterium]